MSFIVIGFYTNGTPYEQEIQGLVKSCANFDIQCEIRGYESRGNWHENTGIKPEFILDMMEEFPQHDLVYIDADGIVQKYPKLFDTIQADLAIHYKDGKECLSGTIFIRNNEKMKMFIKCWINVLCNYPSYVDQKALNHAIKKYAKSLDIVVEDLPATYTQIFDLMKNCGEPVIEHFQASRRFKKSISEKTFIPEFVMGMRTREAGDGSFFLPRANQEVLKFLEKDFFKFPGENRWFPKQSSGRPLEEIEGYFEGRDCYIVGKGPSLDSLKKEDFADPTLPIICINESIHKVETLDLPNKTFAMQQDAWLKNTCKPQFAGLLLSYSCRFWYPDIEEKYVFHFSNLQLNTNNLTVVYALALAKMYGCTGFQLLCFDACVNEETGYGNCIGYQSDRGGSPQRFLSHRRVIEMYATPLPLKFIIPKVPSSRVVYKPQQSQHNRRGHRALFLV